MRHLLPAAQKIDAGYCAHPSFIEEAELRDMKGPLAIAAAETDAIFPEEKRHRTEEILKEMGATYQINLYSGTRVPSAWRPSSPPEYPPIFMHSYFSPRFCCLPPFLFHLPVFSFFSPGISRQSCVLIVLKQIGVEHGFAVRGDLSKRHTLYAKESAFLMALQFFEEHLK